MLLTVKKSEGSSSEKAVKLFVGESGSVTHMPSTGPAALSLSTASNAEPAQLKRGGLSLTSIMVTVMLTMVELAGVPPSVAVI